MLGIRKKVEQYKRELERLKNRSPERQRYYIYETNADSLPQWVPRPVLCWVAIDAEEDRELRAVVYASPRYGDGVPVYTDILGDRWLYAEPVQQEA